MFSLFESDLAGRALELFEMVVDRPIIQKEIGGE
jgi:hypothetical protein